MKLRSVISMLLTTLILLSACGSANDGAKDTSGADTTVATTVGNDAAAEDFNTALRFVVASDTHISSSEDVTAERFAALFTSSYAYAESQEYSTLDAVVVVGDLTNLGEESEIFAFNTVLEENIREETVFIPVLGNHDLPTDNGKPFMETYGEGDVHVNVKGYHFIGISPIRSEDYSRSLDWLEAELAAAAADDPEKPIITFQHHHIKDTVHVSEEWYTEDSDALDAIYSKYSQVLNFSGHSHGPINHPTSVFQRNFTMFGTGTLAYFEMNSGMTYGTTPPAAEEAAQFYIVEVSDDNRVRVMPYNLLTDDFFKTADGSSQLIYRVDDLKDTSGWLYTEKRAEDSAAPAFGDGAAVTVKTAYSTTAQVTIPQASDDDMVYSYNILCTPETGEAVEFGYFSEYYLEPMPETLTFTLGGLAPATKYTVKVTPVDAFGKVGEPITGTLTTAAVSSEYTAKGDVNHAGTFNSFDSIDSVTLSTSNPAYGKSPDGDVFVGDYGTSTPDGGAVAEIIDGGWNGTSALAFSSSVKDEMDMQLFATDENGSTTALPGGKYLRVWVDFTNIDFYYAAFGLIAPTGSIYTSHANTDAADSEFWYKAEGSDEWVSMELGDYGAFGMKQNCSVKDLRGWLAFTVEDLVLYGESDNGLEGEGGAYPYDEVAGVYFYWDYAARTTAGTPIIIDEIGFVEDYTVFEEYAG